MKNSPPQIGREELASRLAGPNPPLVIDVLPEEEYQASHVRGAKNACVFNVTFLDEVARLAPDASHPLVLYGTSSRDLASTTAAEKLAAAGYTHAADYRGGLEDWRTAGLPVEVNPSGAKRRALPGDGTHQIDVAKSKIEWTGRNLTSAHSGLLRLRAGQIEVRAGSPVRGAFTIDMESMEDMDIQDSQMRQILIKHLKSDDFFDTEHYPVAEFQLLSITALPHARLGTPNHEVSGELTLKGVTDKVAFPAIIGPTADGLLAVDAHFDIDRTRWSVFYGSGKFYEKIGKHLVHDEVSLALKLLTLPSHRPFGA